EVRAPVAALRAVGVEHALDVLGYVAERIGLPRQPGRGRHLDADVRVFGERDCRRNAFRNLVLRHHGRRHAHVVEDKLESWVALRDAAKRRGGGGAKHMTGSSAFSAAAQNQSIDPSVSWGSVCGVLKITRKPTMPG